MPAITLYPYQREWLLNRSRFKVGMFARQTGNTLLDSGEANKEFFFLLRRK